MKHFGVIAALVTVSLALAAAAQTDKTEAPGWITAANQPCKIWNPEPQPDESVTWSGGCEGGFASGQGVLRWTENGKPDVEFDGEYAKGKRNGPGVIITPDGRRMAGVWVDDEQLAAPGNSI